MPTLLPTHQTPPETLFPPVSAESDSTSVLLQVGSEVARRARGLGMICIAHDPFASEAKAAAIGVRLVGLDEALAQGDFFSLHMPLTSQTKVCLGPCQFASNGSASCHKTRSISAMLMISTSIRCYWCSGSKITVTVTSSVCTVTEYASV